MQSFQYVRADSVKAAVALAGQNKEARYIAGGTNLLDLMKLHVMQPSLLIDITRLPLNKVEARDKGLFLGALALNSDVAQDSRVQKDYPLLSEALLAGASPQLRNMATIAGNLLQRTRCPYFNDTGTACNKRQPGSGCPAIEGINRMHAILGSSSSCIAAHPSDMAVALTALNATVSIQGIKGERKVPIREFYLEPGDHPEKENVLEAGDLIVGVQLPAAVAGQKAHYLKVRDRASYAFALVSVGALLNVEGGRIREAHIALGGVGTKPWHAAEAEASLKGVKVGEEAFKAAADAALGGAKTQKHNAFKVELAKRAIVQTLQDLTKEA